MGYFSEIQYNKFYGVLGMNNRQSKTAYSKIIKGQYQNVSGELSKFWTASAVNSIAKCCQIRNKELLKKYPLSNQNGNFVKLRTKS